MQRSTERILTTHTGSLPRPLDLVAALEAQDAGTAPEPRIGIPKGIFALAPQEHAPGVPQHHLPTDSGMIFLVSPGKKRE